MTNVNAKIDNLRRQIDGLQDQISTENRPEYCQNWLTFEKLRASLGEIELAVGEHILNIRTEQYESLLGSSLATGRKVQADMEICSAEATQFLQECVARQDERNILIDKIQKEAEKYPEFNIQ